MFAKKQIDTKTHDTNATATGEYNRVRVLFNDQLNLARGKYIPKVYAQKGEARFCSGTFALTYSRSLIPAPGSMFLEGLPDVEALFDPNALRPSWEDNTKIAIADLAFNGSSFPLCGRSELKRAISDWKALGYQPMVGLEAEAYIFQRDANGQWVPYDSPGSYVYGTGPFSDPEGLMELIWSAASACGLPVESINAEFDPPQYELVMQYTDALQACDDFFLFRQMARELLIQRGYLLSFMPKPIPELSGTGMHINISMNDKNGKNAFANGTAPDNMSDLVKGCVAGLIDHHEALGAIHAPTVNSYQRLVPASLSGYWANWGFDHRSTAVRVSAETGSGARIEHRLGDCAANPYFAVAAALQSARLGFLNKTALPDPLESDGLETVNTDRHVADNLEKSLINLEAKPELVNAIGKELVDNYLFVKRAEIAELEGKSEREIFDYYAPFI